MTQRRKVATTVKWFPAGQAIQMKTALTTIGISGALLMNPSALMGTLMTPWLLVGLPLMTPWACGGLPLTPY
jgi:hypothetical protein